MLKNISIKIIKLYQKIKGPWHGMCKYTPTCSEYARIALERYGFIKGWYLSIKRIIRCNPFSKGGYDPVPNKKEVS